MAGARYTHACEAQPVSEAATSISQILSVYDGLPFSGFGDGYPSITLIPGAGARAILCRARAISPEGSKDRIAKVVQKSSILSVNNPPSQVFGRTRRSQARRAS